MIKSVNITNYKGHTLRFKLSEPSENGIYIKNIDGLGYPQGSINYSEVINNNVSNYNGTKRQPRNVVITFAFIEPALVETSRHIIYDYFLSDSETLMEFILDSRTCFLNGYVETITPNIFSQDETVQVSIICPDPYFYTGAVISDVFTNSIPNFEFSKWFEHFDNYGTWNDSLKDSSGDFIRDSSSEIIQDGIPGSPLSTISKSGISGTVYSRFSNPKGFTIIIRSKSENKVAFNKVELQTENGIIYINKDNLTSSGIPIDEFNPSYDDNIFNPGNEIAIVNDINDQNIYLISPGDFGTLKYKKSILDISYIEGFFPLLQTGKNYFTARVSGVDTRLVDESFVRNGDEIINEIYSDRHLDIRPCYKFFMDFFSPVKEYLKEDEDDRLLRIEVSTNDENFKEHGESGIIDNIDVNYIYKLSEGEIYTDVNGNSIGKGYSYYRKFFGPYNTVDEIPEKAKNKGLIIEENSSWYCILVLAYPCSVIAQGISPSWNGPSAIHLDLKLIKKYRKNSLEKLSYLEHSTTRDIKLNCMYKYVRVDGQKINEAYCRDFDDVFEMCVSYDEMYDAL